MRRIVVGIAWNLGLPIVLVTIIALATARAESVFFPTPGDVAAVFPATWDSTRFVDDVVPSVLRLLTGLSIAASVSIVLGTVLGMLPRLYYMTDPAIAFLRAVPAPALLPVLLIVFGIGDLTRVTTIALGTTWPMLMNTIDGVRGVPLAQRETMQVLGLPFLQRWWLSFCHASPQFFAGARQSIALAIILMVVSEMVMSTNGIGYTIIQFQRQFAIPRMWSGIVVLGALGVLASWAGERLERVSTRWYVEMTRQQELVR